MVIAIGEDIEANILATLIVKGMPKPKVWAKANNPNHHKILENWALTISCIRNTKWACASRAEWSIPR